MSSIEMPPFGVLLKQLRKRAGMTQRELAAALNYSGTLISNLEDGKRLPTVEAVRSRFVAALGLEDEPALAATLIAAAAAARGERLPQLPQSADNQPINGRAGAPKRSAEFPTHLPVSPTALIGRDEEVNHLCNRLLGHTGRLLTLVGPPGIGKTQLALAVARALQNSYGDGAIFVALAEIVDADVMASTISATVGWEDDSSKAPQRKLIESLRRKKMLLVLDNCEQIPNAALVVAEILASCPGVVLLATSRERLHLRAEQRYQVPPLSLDSAVELFSQRAAAVNASFLLTEANRPTVEAICEKLELLPLALELCAAQSDFLLPDQLLEELQNNPLDLLVDGAYDLPPQQRTLRHAIQRSYALLTEQERRLFRSLGVFVGGFALPEFEALGTWQDANHSDNAGQSSTPLTALHALVGKSLVRVETLPSGQQRYFLLEMIREFAVEQMRANEEEAALRECHFDLYLRFARAANRLGQEGERTTWQEQIEANHDNIRACLQWVLEQARFLDAAWLVIALESFWTECGYSYEGARWIAQILPHRSTLTNDQRLTILLAYYSFTGYALKELRPEDFYIDEVMQLLESNAHPLLRASTLVFLPEISADIDRAAALKQAVTLARAALNYPKLGAEFCHFTYPEKILSHGLWAYGQCLTEQGDVEKAVLIATECHQLAVANDDQIRIDDSIGIWGHVALLRGDLVQAERLFHEVVTHATSYDSLIMLCEWQPLLGLATLYLGKTAEARQVLTESLHHCLKFRNRIYLKWVCTYLAEVALWEEEFDEAGEWLAQSMSYHNELLRVTIYEVRRLFLFANLAVARQEYPRAALLFGLAEAAHSQIHSIFYAGPMGPQIEMALATTRAALGAEGFDAEFAAGQRLALGEAYSTILK